MIKPDTRPFILTRASYAGGQRYAATWTGDNSATWNHLRLTTSMLKNLGLSGFSLAGADVGGYAGTPSAELLTKWIEIAAFQPLDRDHAEKGTGPHEPWANGPTQEAIRRRFIDTRYELLPYLYTVMEENIRTGLPLLRPLFLEFPDAAADHHPIDLDPDAGGEFMVGPDLLVAAPPFPDKANDYDAKLPSSGCMTSGPAIELGRATRRRLPTDNNRIRPRVRLCQPPIFILTSRACPSSFARARSSPSRPSSKAPTSGPKAPSSCESSPGRTAQVNFIRMTEPVSPTSKGTFSA